MRSRLNSTVIAAAIALSLMPTQIATGETVTLHGNGAYFSARNCTTNACFWFYATLANSGGAPATYLTFYIFVADPSTGAYTSVDGYGVIPNAALQITRNSASLDVNTNLAGFHNFICSTDGTNPVTCGDGPGGPVTASATAISSVYSGRSSGTSESTTAGQTFKITGSSEFSYAVGTGTFFSYSPSLQAEIGTNHNTQITFTF